MQTYVIGQMQVPSWCSRLVTPYKRMDGSIGIEFHGKDKELEMRKGDKLVKNGDRIDVVRKEVKT